MVWHMLGTKPSPELTITQFTDALPGLGDSSCQSLEDVVLILNKYFQTHLGIDVHVLNIPCEICEGGWGCEVSCGGHHRPRGKTTTGSALDGAVFDIAQILAYLVHNMSRSQLYLGFGHFG